MIDFWRVNDFVEYDDVSSFCTHDLWGREWTFSSLAGGDIININHVAYIIIWLIVHEIPCHETADIIRFVLYSV